MNHREFVRRFVLMKIADDYESLEYISPLIAKEASECGMTISDAEIRQGLVELIEAGLARAYCLGSDPVLEIWGVPAPDQFEDSYTHYWATPQGTALLTGDRDWWPFDDEGELRANWKPPEG
jgi:hypothetical protein